MKASDFFALPASLSRFASFFPAGVAPWEWLKRLEAALESVEAGAGGPAVPPGVQVEGRVWLHPTVKLPAFAVIRGPVFLGAHCEVRPGAFVRGNVIAGERCVLGNASEFKHCLLLDGVQAPHFNYVGDSVLGNGAHLGAGVICSNLRLDQGEVKVKLASGELLGTGLRKFGAILGDRAEVGCNAVLNPGSLLGPRALVMPGVSFGGLLPANSVARTRQAVTITARRD
ncbi:MAG: UDP-N-acetylglucosamine diphosphorylase [Opitutaceae bacterium]|nr:UDP-N-acetylglucosamine diphosphorylase [Opitutaceae bacterium]